MKQKNAIFLVLGLCILFMGCIQQQVNVNPTPTPNPTQAPASDIRTAIIGMWENTTIANRLVYNFSGDGSYNWYVKTDDSELQGKGKYEVIDQNHILITVTAQKNSNDKEIQDIPIDKQQPGKVYIRIEGSKMTLEDERGTKIVVTKI